MNVLNVLLRRRGPSEGDAKQPQQAAQKPPASAKRTKGKSDDGTFELGGDLLPSRRQASQVNLNRYLAAAPSGLTAVLKKPSRGDILAEPSTHGERGSCPDEPTSQPAQPAQGGQLPPQQTQASGETAYEPSVRGRPTRERRKSISLSEMAQGVQSLDVSQAALIMMPARLKAELGASGAAAIAQLPLISRSAGFPTGSLSSALGSGSAGTDAAAHVSASGALGSGTALAAARGYDRKPSIIREAVKQQQQQYAAPVRAAAQPDAVVRGHPAALNGDLGLMQLASALAGQGPDRGPGQRPGAAPERRTSMLVVQQQQQQQQQGHAPPSRVSVNGGVAGLGAQQAQGQSAVSGVAAVPGPPPAAHGSVRRSDPGDGFRSRAAAAAPIDVVINNVRGMNRSWGSGADEAAGAAGSSSQLAVPPPAPSAPAAALVSSARSNKELRPTAIGGRSEGVNESEGLRPGSSAHASLSGEVRLPKVPGPGLSSGRRDKGRERDNGSSAPVARASITPADVAAITEAMAAYQSEAGRLRAAALRKVDTKIKRAVMERYLGPEPEYPSSPGVRAHDSNALSPTLRSQAQVKPRLAITPPPQPPQQRRSPQSARLPQRPESHRSGTTSSGNWALQQEAGVTGAREEPAELLSRNGIGGLRSPMEPFAEIAIQRRW